MRALRRVHSDGPHWTEAGTDAGRSAATPSGRERHLERTRRLALLNRVLSVYGCAADDWAGAHYMVHRRGGEVATDLPTPWAAVEGLTGHAPDPLDLALVARLEERPAAGRAPGG